MRFRFLNFLKCFAIVGVATLASCSKDDDKGVPQNVQGAFAIGGQKYNTLQDAVNAVMSSQDETAVITLTTSTTGDGFTVKDGILNIDFGQNIYYLNPGKTLNLDNSIVSMTGKGGELVGEGTIVKGSESGLSFEGNLNIEGDMDVKSMDYFGFIEDYSGVYSGSVNLNETYMYVEADKAVLNINTLNPVNSTLNVISAKSVNVGNVVKGSSNFPVCSAVADVVKVNGGATVHVHKYGAGVPVSCASTEHMAKTCSECEDVILYIDENNTKLGSCHAELLEHVEGVAATETTWGNVEYWECPLCGAYYSDEHAQNILAPQNIMIKPVSSVDFRKFGYASAASATRAPINPEVIKKVISGITKVVQFATEIYKAIDNRATEEQLFMDLIENMNEKLNEIKDMLKNVQQDLDDLKGMVTGEAAKLTLGARMTTLKDHSTEMSSFEDIYNTLLYHGFSQTALATVLKNWDNGHRAKETIDLMNAYASLGGTKGNVDGMWKAIVTPQCPWEHEGYGARITAMQDEAGVLLYSAAMTVCYYVYAKDYQPTVVDDDITEEELEELIVGMKLKDIKNLRETLESYQKDIEAALNVIEERDQYIYLVINGVDKDVRLNKQIGTYDVYQAMEDNYKNVNLQWELHSKDNTKELSAYVNVDDIFDEQFFNKVMTFYSDPNNPNAPVNPVGLLRKSGFTGLDEGCRVFISLHNKEHVVDSGARQAYCRNWNWCSHKSPNDDWIYFRGILYDKNIPVGAKSFWGADRVIYDANICGSDGEISNFGKKPEGLGVYKSISRQ